MKRNFTKVDRVAQMTMQEELIAKKKQEILEKQRTKEIGKQIAAAQKNVATNLDSANKEASENEQKSSNESETKPVSNVHPLIAAANIPKLQNNFCNDGSFFEYYKKIIEQTKKEEEAKKQAEVKLKTELNIVDEDAKPEAEPQVSSEGGYEMNEDDVQNETQNPLETPDLNSGDNGDENKATETNNIKLEEEQQNQIDDIKTEPIDKINVTQHEPPVCNINSGNISSNAPVVPTPTPYNDALKQYKMKTENQLFNQSFQPNANPPPIAVATRPSYLQGPYATQLTSQPNTMPIHIPQTFSIAPNATFNLNLPPPMINFAIQQPTPPPPPPPMPVILPLPQPAPNLFPNSYSNPSIFLMQHQTPPQISIPYQQQAQPMQLPQQQPPPVSMLQTAPPPQVTQVLQGPVTQTTITQQNSINEIPSRASPVAQVLPQFQHIEKQELSPMINEDSEEKLSMSETEDQKDISKIESTSEGRSRSSRSNTNSPLSEKDVKDTVFSEDSKRVDQTKSLLPTSLQSCIDMVAENGDAFEDFIRSKKDEVHSSLWFLFDLESDEYGIYRQSVLKIREEVRNRKRNAIYKSNDEKYDPESVCDDGADNDSDDEYMKGMLNRNTNNLKRRIETRVEFEEEERRQAEEERQKKRKSRWGEKIESTDVPTVTAIVQTSFGNQHKPILNSIQRTDPALLQYAKLNYGGTNLSEEDWKKCEEHFKVNLLYQDMMRKRREIDQLAKSGKFKYEYDSDEDTEGGTWEHKLRMAEMEATNAWAQALTKQSEGKHHIGDFLPPEELKKFMEQYEAKKNNRQPDLSDYKEFKLKEDNKGFQMLQKLGWQEGQGLGAGGDGIVDPINNVLQNIS
ncbi:SURP and G-patch domain-containing protein 1 isoform X2 [Condylostylus longicornis]|uniref:SURP and G-patch domain-containing protein 1 isoform X2 n=1 Tax=Condylostylus longicornis TaxID=2530218 RepID=UPI00244E1E5B|nr:SURP and G-patch domain-containing protein 1 isoform X2 [Condylostylus longicornis]